MQNNPAALYTSSTAGHQSYLDLYTDYSYHNSVIFVNEIFEYCFIRKLYFRKCQHFPKKLRKIISKKIDRAMQKEQNSQNTKLEAVQASNEELYNIDR